MKEKGFIIAVALMAAVLLTGCKTTTKVVTVPVVHTDSVEVKKVEKDSVHVHDSIYIRDAGDTVWVERWHTKYQKVLRVDTMREVRVDSVPYPVEVIKEVPAELTWWEKTRMKVGDAAMVLLAGLAVAGVLWLVKKIRG